MDTCIGAENIDRNSDDYQPNLLASNAKSRRRRRRRQNNDNDDDKRAALVALTAIDVAGGGGWGRAKYGACDRLPGWLAGCRAALCVLCL